MVHRARTAYLILLLLPLAGCLGAGTGQEETPMVERPGTLNGTADAALSSTGRWTEPFEGEVPAVNMVLLHDGRVLYWSGIDARAGANPNETLGINGPYPAPSESRIVDFSNGTPMILVPNVPLDGIDLFCSGQTILPDGRVLAAGGTDWAWIPEGTIGIRGHQAVRIFDPATDTWSEGGNLTLGRWYPSVLTTDKGEVFTAGGIGHWVDPSEHWPSWETIQDTDDAWREVEGTDQLLPLYPHVYQVAGGPYKGGFFADTVGALWAPFGEHPQQNEWNQQWFFDADAGTWTDLGRSQFGARSYAGHVMLPLQPYRDYAPQFLTMGGSLQQGTIGVPFAETTDLSTSPPRKQTVAAMQTPRWHPVPVVLPGGDVLTLGGSHYDNVAIYGAPTMPPILDAEIYDPGTDSWRSGGDMHVERVYHSTAVLLPDATVLVGGHVPDPQYMGALRATVNPQIVETRLEIYEPGYLFRGDRPVIVDAPTRVEYAQTFQVDVELPADLDHFLLVRPGAVTHIYDSNSRHIVLPTLARDGTTFTVEAPPDGAVAPPGDYMLFALSQHDEGPVPSVATWVHIE